MSIRAPPAPSPSKTRTNGAPRWSNSAALNTMLGSPASIAGLPAKQRVRHRRPAVVGQRTQERIDRHGGCADLVAICPTLLTPGKPVSTLIRLYAPMRH